MTSIIMILTTITIITITQLQQPGLRAQTNIIIIKTVATQQKYLKVLKRTKIARVKTG